MRSAFLFSGCGLRFSQTTAMSRKRHSYQRPRQIPNTERSYLAYQYDVPAQATSRAEIVRLLRGGEDTYLELKVRFSNPEKLTAEIIALANTDGGALIFGVNDQLRIEGVNDPESVEEQLRELCATQIQPPVFPYINKVAFDSGRRIVVLEVEPHNRPHRTLNDEFYLREGAIKRETTREELSQIYGETQLVRFEQTPVFKAHCESDIDESLFWSYVRGVNPGYWGENTKGFPTATLLRELGLAVQFKDELIPTIGGLLLFGMNERVTQLLPQASVQLTRYSGADLHAPIVERVHIQGNLLRLFDGALHFVRRYADLWDAKPNRKTMEEGHEAGRANYSRAAVHEALTNALVHRAWQVRDGLTRVFVFDDAIEIFNPASPLELPISSLRYGVTQAHNPRLKAIFTNEHYGAHPAHGGLPMLFVQSMDFARRAPAGPSLVNHEFRLKLYGLR
jgi:predicted HTH transcriptional regulator